MGGGASASPSNCHWRHLSPPGPSSAVLRRPQSFPKALLHALTDLDSSFKEKIEASKADLEPPVTTKLTSPLCPSTLLLTEGQSSACALDPTTLSCFLEGFRLSHILSLLAEESLSVDVIVPSSNQHVSALCEAPSLEPTFLPSDPSSLSSAAQAPCKESALAATGPPFRFPSFDSPLALAFAFPLLPKF